MVNEAGRFEVLYNSSNRPVAISEQQIERFKDILTRNIEPGSMRKPDQKNVRIDFYKNNLRTAYLDIVNNHQQPFVNFYSENINFGFRLTYGIGQAVDDLYPGRKTYK